MASADGGYEDQRFESDVTDSLYCAICLNVLKQPMQCVRNEHSFCKPCITRYVKESQRCPTCMEPLTLQTLRSSRVITELISQLKIKCDNVERGCSEFVKVGMLEEHVKHCEFGPVECSNDRCELIVSRKDLAQHEMNDCNFRKGRCEVCGKDVPYGKRKLHCYVTRTEMGKVREEISSIKEIVTNLSRELTRDIGDMKDQMGDMKDEMSEIKHEIDEVKKEMDLVKQQLQSSIRSHGLLVPSLEQNVNIRNDLIVAGGGIESSVEMFSWTTRQWTHLPPMTSERYCSSSFVHEDQMFVCGGVWSEDSIEVLNLKEQGAQWKKFTAKLPQWTFGHTTVVYENNLFIFGGVSGGKVVNDIYKVSLVPPYSSQLVCHLSEPRTWHGAQCFGDKVVIVGGTTTGDTGDSLDKVLLYDITNNCCQTLAPLPFAVCCMATVAWKDNIIIIGGWDKNDKTLNTVVVYNTTNGKSTMLPPMKHERACCAAVLVDNIIVVMGGLNDKEKSLNSVESFNFCNCSWEELPPMNKERGSLTAVVRCTF